MTNGLPIVIPEGASTVGWRGGYQTLTWLPPDRDPNEDMWEFGVRVDPGGKDVWFRIDSKDISRMRENTAELRGKRLVACLINWCNASDNHQLESLDEFQVSVSDDGNTRIERSGG